MIREPLGAIFGGGKFDTPAVLQIVGQSARSFQIVFDNGFAPADGLGFGVEGRKSCATCRTSDLPADIELRGATLLVNSISFTVTAAHPVLPDSVLTELELRL